MCCGHTFARLVKKPPKRKRNNSMLPWAKAVPATLSGSFSPPPPLIGPAPLSQARPASGQGGGGKQKASKAFPPRPTYLSQTWATERGIPSFFLHRHLYLPPTPPRKNLRLPLRHLFFFWPVVKIHERRFSLWCQRQSSEKEEIPGSASRRNGPPYPGGEARLQLGRKAPEYIFKTHPVTRRGERRKKGASSPGKREKKRNKCGRKILNSSPAAENERTVGASEQFILHASGKETYPNTLKCVQGIEFGECVQGLTLQDDLLLRHLAEGLEELLLPGPVVGRRRQRQGGAGARLRVRILRWKKEEQALFRTVLRTEKGYKSVSW